MAERKEFAIVRPGQTIETIVFVVRTIINWNTQQLVRSVQRDQTDAVLDQQSHTVGSKQTNRIDRR